MMARPEWRDGGDSIHLLSWVNRYDPSTERCYVKVNWINRDAKKDKAPLLSYELYDAFDHDSLAFCTDERPEDNLCSISSNPAVTGDCTRCRAFVNELMASGGSTRR